MLKAPLTPAEQSFVEAMARSALWGPDYYRDWISRSAPQTPGLGLGDPADPAPNQAQGADLKRPALRAEIIRAFMDEQSGGPSLSKGIQIRHARIIGALDLEGVRYDRPIALVDTEFEKGLVIRDATLRALTLDRSVIPFIDGAHVHIQGALRARRMPQTEWINLLSAQIDGHLVLQGSPLNPEQKSLSENGGMVLQCTAAKVGGSVFLRHGFAAYGPAYFVRAHIDGQLSCVGGLFYNPGGLALYANAAEIGLDVFIDDGFEAQGEVNFTAARVGGQFSCFKGTFQNHGGVALDCDGAMIASDVFLKDGFLARGKVVFSRAQIGGGFQLRQHSRIEGEVDMTGASVGALMDDAGCWPALPHSIHLDGFTYGRFGDGAPVSWRMRVPWLQRSLGSTGRPLFRPQPWSQAASVLSSMGLDYDARVVLQRREKARPIQAAWPWKSLARFGKGLHAVTSGYGYRPGLLLLWALLVIFIGGLTFGSATRPVPMVPREVTALTASADLAPAPEGETVPVPRHYEPFKPWLYSLDLVLPLIDLGQARYWMPQDPPGPPARPEGQIAGPSAAERMDSFIEHGIFGWLPKVWFWIHSLLGWLLSGLLIAGYAGWLRRR